MMYLGRRARYGVPAVAVLAVGLAAWVPTLSGASAPPGLAPQSVTQLLADMAKAQAPELSGSLTWTANLGLSDLSALESGAAGGGGTAGGTSGFDPLTMLSGSYQIDVWMDGARAEHLALLLPPAEEMDLVRNGDQAWLWDSSTNTATHLVGAAATAPVPTTGPATSPATTAAGPALTPQQMASRLLSHVDGTTSVTLGDPIYVAGQAAYQLIVAPTSAPGSTVDHIEVDIGATGPLFGVPLQVAVYAQGQTAAALELGFTGVLNVGPPPSAELSFTPPPGARVVTHTLAGRGARPASGAGGAGPATGAGDVHRMGTGWTTVITGASGQLGNQAEQGALSEATTIVNFDGQQGRLFSTDLLNVLILADGQFYAGLVAPSVLEADASSASAGASSASAGASPASAGASPAAAPASS